MLRSVLKETTYEELVLIHFPVDDSTSIVKMGRVTPGKAGEELQPGILCKVKEGKKLYDGRILAIGSEKNLLAVEAEFQKEGEEDESDFLETDTRTEIEEVERKATTEIEEAESEVEEVVEVKKKCTKRQASKENSNEPKKKKSVKAHGKKIDDKKTDAKRKLQDKKGSIIVISDQNDSDETNIDKNLEDDSFLIDFTESNHELESDSQSSKVKESICISESDYLDLCVQIDELQGRLKRTEDLLTGTIARISHLENNSMAHHTFTQPSSVHGNSHLLSTHFQSPSHEPPFNCTRPPPPAVYHNYIQSPVYHQDPVQHFNQSPVFQQHYTRSPLIDGDDEPPPLPSPISSPVTDSYAPAQYLQPRKLLNEKVPCSQVPKCFPIKGKLRKDQQLSLASIQINKDNLEPYDIVVRKNSHLHREAVIGKLAVKLAKESFFGDEVLKKCTVMGCRDIPALPLKELNDMKQVVFDLFPKYWSNPAEFESVIWSQCVTSIGQLCKRLRNS